MCNHIYIYNVYTYSVYLKLESNRLNLYYSEYHALLQSSGIPVNLFICYKKKKTQTKNH